MEDVEVILRFFALRNATNYQKGMRGFLDLYMLKSRIFSEDDIIKLKKLYEETISTALNIFGEYLFRIYDTSKSKWIDSKQKAFADAILVGVSKHLDHADLLIARRDDVIDATRLLFSNLEEGALTGRANTKKDVLQRIETVTDMLRNIAQ